MRYLSVIHNRGARIGHQVHNYFLSLLISNSYDFKLVYNSFSGNSSYFDPILNFERMHEFHYFKNRPNVDEIKIGLKKIEKDVLYIIDLNKKEDEEIFLQLVKGKIENVFKFYKDGNISLFANPNVPVGPIECEDNMRE